MTPARPTKLLRLGSIAIVASLAAGLVGASLAVSAPAMADTSPATASGLPATFSADPLPTVQVNGVVWATATVGNTTYAAGSFTSARPAGAPPGVNETPVGNLIAYNITTGAMIPTFNPLLNAQALALAVSPDHKTLYVGGDFTYVGSAYQSRLAAFDIATGALSKTFLARVGYRVNAIAATASTVYVGGGFTGAGNAVPRTNLAAFSTANGALTDWAPVTDISGGVQAMVLAPDQSRVIVGGHFKTVNGVAAMGTASIDVNTGQLLPWAANQTMHAYGLQGATLSLMTDGKLIYGAAYSNETSPSNFEGRFAADPYTGALVFANDCHGDTYSVYATNGVLYSVGHTHDCTPAGGFSNPTTLVDPVSTRGPWYRAVAEGVTPVGNNTGLDTYGWDYSRVPHSALYAWFPDLTTGDVTLARQAAWSITGNSAGTYLALGGEFPAVNGIAQQGLVRFAVPSIAPNKVGPQRSSVKPPTAVEGAVAGSVNVTWPSAWDPDDEMLTYRVIRDGATFSIYTATVASTFWKTSTMRFTDTGMPATVHSYVITVTDPHGNTVASASTEIKVTKGAVGH